MHGLFFSSLCVDLMLSTDVIHGYPVLCLIVHLGMYLLTWSFTKVLRERPFNKQKQQWHRHNMEWV
jgi:hypothetical protein